MKLKVVTFKRQRKEKQLAEFSRLIREFRYIIMMDLTKINASFLNELRRVGKTLECIIKGGKKTILLKALEIAGCKNISQLKKEMHGQLIFIFSNRNPIEVALKLSEMKVELPLSVGEVSPVDVVVPSGNTGIPPGPIISIFTTLGIPTKIIGGAIHIVKDTLVLRAGEKASQNVVTLLNKLGIKPIKMNISYRLAYDIIDGVIIKKEHLLPDLNAVKKQIEDALYNALKLSLKLQHVNRYTLLPMIVYCYKSALELSLKIGYVTKETAPLLIRRAYLQALCLHTLLQKST
ncbi:MAG: 50S ribosomal protein L10 [Candidatus Geothermarchaeota archaeon]